MLNRQSCSECDDSGELPDGSACSACCEHMETDHGICYDCGEDITDELASRAYDHAKASRYDD